MANFYDGWLTEEELKQGVSCDYEDCSGTYVRKSHWVCDTCGSVISSLEEFKKSHPNVIVGTHDGVFHADDVFAIAAMSIKYPNIIVARSRDNFDWDLWDYLIDVGGDYVEGVIYDHHQNSNPEPRSNGVPYSSFGLVWKDEMSEILDPLVWEDVDKNFVQYIDAADNGQPLHSGSALTLNSVINAFNPNWNSSEDPEACFNRALKFAKEHLARVLGKSQSKFEARKIIDQSPRLEGGILCLPYWVPWADYVQEMDPDREITKVIWPHRDIWRIQGRPEKPRSFKCLLTLPKVLRGFNELELKEVTGRDDLTFVHPKGFTGGAFTKEGVLYLASVME